MLTWQTTLMDQCHFQWILENASTPAKLVPKGRDSQTLILVFSENQKWLLTRWTRRNSLTMVQWGPSKSTYKYIESADSDSSDFHWVQLVFVINRFWQRDNSILFSHKLRFSFFQNSSRTTTSFYGLLINPIKLVLACIPRFFEPIRKLRKLILIPHSAIKRGIAHGIAMKFTKKIMHGLYFTFIRNKTCCPFHKKIENIQSFQPSQVPL